MKNLAQMLQGWRQLHEYTLSEAAARIGIGRTAIHRIERGENPDGRTLAKLLCWMLEEGR